MRAIPRPFGAFITVTALVIFTLSLPGSAEAQRAVRRGDPSGQQSGGGGQERGAPSPRSGGERRAAPPRSAAPRNEAPPPDTASGGDTSARPGSSSDDQREPDDRTASERRRGDSSESGVAVARRTPRPSGPSTIVVPGGWYPWGWGGYGFAGYYGVYDPWYYGGWGYRSTYYERREEGSVRLKVKPRHAEVYVDGYFAGHVDDFDGIFQSMPLEPGPHRIEVQLEGYTPLIYDVRVLSGRKVTFEGELQRLP